VELRGLRSVAVINGVRPSAWGPGGATTADASTTGRLELNVRSVLGRSHASGAAGTPHMKISSRALRARLTGCHPSQHDGPVKRQTGPRSGPMACRSSKPRAEA